MMLKPRIMPLSQFEATVHRMLDTERHAAYLTSPPEIRAARDIANEHAAALKRTYRLLLEENEGLKKALTEAALRQVP